MLANSLLRFSALLLIAGVSCYDNRTAGDLPKDILSQLQHMRSQQKLDIQEGCRRFQAVEVGFLLYTRNNSDVPIPVNAKEVDLSKKVVLLIHGWLSTPYSSGITQMKDAYLKRYDCNVIVVDWSQMASKLYVTAYCHTSKVSNYLAKFLCESKIPLKDLHVVGHSMGAHIAGVAAQYTNMKCKQQIGRITGLDPSAHLFQNLPERRRLDKSDAQFVDVIHSDQMNFGYAGNLGHVDFHPNCGQNQPGCPSVTNIIDSTSLRDVFCNQHRSLEYMTESITSSQFVGVSCGMCPRYCRANLINAEYTVMGEDCRTVTRSSNKFYLTTKSSAPFAEGWTLQDAKLP